MPQVGWYGLGSMGLNMAANLCRSLDSNENQHLRFSNRTMSKGQSLVELGCEAVASFTELLQSCHIIFTMISDDAVLQHLTEQAMQMQDLQNKIWVDTSTVHPKTTRSTAALLRTMGIHFIASPVFGASAAAAEGQLIFAMAGPAESIATVKPYIQDVMAKRVIELGEDVGRASLLKLTGNLMIIGMQELISEVLVFAEKTELGTDIAEEFVGDMFGSVVQSYSKRITSGSYAPPESQGPGFAVALAIKDTKHALGLGHTADVNLPVAIAAMANMRSARSYAGDCLDSTSMYGALRIQAGLRFLSANAASDRNDTTS